MAKEKVDLRECTAQQKQLNIDIKTLSFKPFYLIWGDESYLRNYYKAELLKALLEGSDPVNLLSIRLEARKSSKKPYEDEAEDGRDISSGFDWQSTLNFAQTLPFFGKRRIVLIEEGGFFKRGYKEWKDYIEAPIETAIFVFVESAADKSSTFFSYLEKIGRTVRCETYNMPDLKKWVASRLGKTYKKVFKEAVIDYFLSKTGSDMSLIYNETEKLSAYVQDKEEITKKDVDAVCIKTEEGIVYKLTNAVSERNRKAAIDEYEALIFQDVKPNIIMTSIIRQIRNLLCISKMQRRHESTDEMEAALGIKGKEFLIKNYLRYIGNFSEGSLSKLLEYCILRDEDVKSGRLDVNAAVEMIIVYCTK